MDGKIDKKAVAERLRVFIKGREISVDNFGELIGVTGNTIRTTYLSGRSLPGAEFLFNLSTIGCDITWLLTGVELQMWATTMLDEKVIIIKRNDIQLENKLKSIRAQVDQLLKDINSIKTGVSNG